MVQFPVWLNTRTKGGDNFPLFWIGGRTGISSNLVQGYLKSPLVVTSMCVAESVPEFQ